MSLLTKQALTSTIVVAVFLNMLASPGRYAVHPEQPSFDDFANEKRLRQSLTATDFQNYQPRRAPNAPFASHVQRPQRHESPSQPCALRRGIHRRSPARDCGFPDRDYRSGMAEVVKYGVILDEPFFDYLEQHIADLNAREGNVLRRIVARSCRLKADVVEQDEYELTGQRAVLNYGHTFGHAFEALGGYGELMHGEAVSIGMLHASRLAERLGRIDASVTERQARLLSALNIPTRLPSSMKLNPADVIDRMRLDKKAVSGELRFVLPTRLGHVETVKDVPESEVIAVLNELSP